MRLPRDISGTDLAKKLKVLGYEETRQEGSHLRMTTQIPTEHHVTVPLHDPLKIGTLNSIVRVLTERHQIEREQLLELLFGWAGSEMTCRACPRN